MGFMELRAGAVGFRVPSLPIFVIVSTTQSFYRRLKTSIKRLPNDSRGEETVNNKIQTQGKSFLFLFLSKIGI